jgi:hypothetical protein
MATVCEDYPGMLISKENFAATQKAVGWLMDGFPEQGFTPRLVDTYWAKGAAIMVCQDQDTRDWLARLVPTLGSLGGLQVQDSGAWRLCLLLRGLWPGFRAPWRTRGHFFGVIVGCTGVLETGQWRTYERRRNLMRSYLSSVWIRHQSMRWREWSGGPSAVWDEPSSSFWVPNQGGGGGEATARPQRR